MVYLLGTPDLPIRGTTRLPPPGPHSVVAGADHLERALAYARTNIRCHSVAVLGSTWDPPDLSPIAGRRLLICDDLRDRMMHMARAAVAAGVEVEWGRFGNLWSPTLAEFLLPVVAVVLATHPDHPEEAGRMLRPAGGAPVIRQVVAAASEGGCHRTMVVCSAPEVAAAVDRYAVTLLAGPGREGAADAFRRCLALVPEWAFGLLLLSGGEERHQAWSVGSFIEHWRRPGGQPVMVRNAVGERGLGAMALLDRDRWPGGLDPRPGIAPG